jgi:hypothetical protein
MVEKLMPEIIYSAHIRRDGKMTYEEALAAGYRTVGLGQRLWEHEDDERQEATGNYRGFKGIRRKRNCIRYHVRFPGAHVVVPYHWSFFIVSVPCFSDAERLARKIGEGTVIQRSESRFRAWNWRKRRGKRTADAFGVRGYGEAYYRRHGRRKPESYRYWIMIEGTLCEIIDHAMKVVDVT